MHCQDANAEDIIHPPVRPLIRFKLEPCEPVSLVLIHIGGRLLRRRFWVVDPFGFDVDKMAVVSFEGIASIQFHELNFPN